MVSISSGALCAAHWRSWGGKNEVSADLPALKIKTVVPVRFCLDTWLFLFLQDITHTHTKKSLD